MYAIYYKCNANDKKTNDTNMELNINMFFHISLHKRKYFLCPVNTLLNRFGMPICLNLVTGVWAY